MEEKKVKVPPFTELNSSQRRKTNQILKFYKLLEGNKYFEGNKARKIDGESSVWEGTEL